MGKNCIFISGGLLLLALFCLPIVMFAVQPVYGTASYCVEYNTKGVIYFNNYIQTNNPLIVNVNEYYQPSSFSYELIKDCPVSVVIGKIRINDKMR